MKSIARRDLLEFKAKSGDGHAAGSTSRPPGNPRPGRRPARGAGALTVGIAGVSAAVLAFLRRHTDVLVLSEESGSAKVAVVPAYQGRIMTTTCAGDAGLSLGWINYELIASGKVLPHMNPYGGEDRFWMGPEGGQFAIFFPKGARFVFEDWQTPAVIDTEPFDVVAITPTEASFRRRAQLENHSGTKFHVQIDRTVRLLDRPRAAGELGAAIPPQVKAVVYESDNQITNMGKDAWSHQTGLLSIWILGMYNPSPRTTVAIPFVPGPEDQLGPKVNDAYFGKIAADRLIVKDDVLFFRCDGKSRGKIGISPMRAKPIAGSYDAANGVLTLVQLTRPPGATEYVNSMWEHQDKPYAGDVVNSYNDGPTTPGGKPLGPFYEIESSSPAAALKPGQSMRHVHRTFHLQGAPRDLDAIARKALGVGLAEIQAAFE